MLITNAAVDSGCAGGGRVRAVAVAVSADTVRPLRLPSLDAEIANNLGAAAAVNGLIAIGFSLAFT